MSPGEQDDISLSNRFNSEVPDYAAMVEKIPGIGELTHYGVGTWKVCLSIAQENAQPDARLRSPALTLVLEEQTAVSVAVRYATIEDLEQLVPLFDGYRQF